MKRSVFIMMTILLSAVIVISCRQTVQAQRESRVLADAQSVHIMEEEYETKVKEVLHANNLTNAGVMMTKVIYADGRREYTVKIHDRRLETLSADDRTKLLVQLSEIGFPLSECQISHLLQLTP
ncbi:MAG: hypothetical protein IJ711_04130 [Lachnospiraceae bacterium]|nr:hypothetical protein [Lachnospiraceae bacterium]